MQSLNTEMSTLKKSFIVLVMLAIIVVVSPFKYKDGRFIYSPESSWAATVDIKITASDGEAGDIFGYSQIDIDGNYAVIGAYKESDNGFWSGSAYIFKRSGSSWTQAARLNASDADSFDFFGSAVSISGDHVVVGAYNDEAGGANRGSAYVFERSGLVWSQVAKLTASDGADSDTFGWAVAIDGDTVVASTTQDDDNGSASGSVYIFVKPGGGWSSMTQTAKLTPGIDGAADDGFGGSVAIDGDNVIIGAAGDDDNGTQSGSAYIFTKPGGGWITTNTYTAKLKPSDGDALDTFGASVAISGDNVLIGAYQDENTIPSDNLGSAYIFTKPGGGWATTSTFTAKLTSSDTATSDFFGWGVSISGNNVVISAIGDDDNGSFSGSAYVFLKPGGGWATTSAFTVKVTASDGAANDQFGHAISVDGGNVLIGAPQDDDNGADSGSAYIYEITPNSPSDFHATAFTGPTATLEWTDNSTNEDGFYLYQSTIDSQPVSPAYTIPADGTEGDIESQAVTLPSNIHHYWLTAYNEFGESSPLKICLRYSAVTGKLLACDPEASDFLGISVSVSGNTAVVGAMGDDDNGTDAGSAYVFEKHNNTWTQVAKLLASDGAASDFFGTAVAIDGDTVVAGAYGDDTYGTDTGAAYIFVKPDNGWSGTMNETARISSSDLGFPIYTYFGKSVAIDGDTVLIGQPSDVGTGRGLIYLKPGGGWVSTNTPDAILNATVENGPGYKIATSVDISGDTVVLGRDFYFLTDSIYIFEKPGGGWANMTETARLSTADISSNNDHFGTAVTIDGDTVVVGAYGKDSGTGAAYIYVKPGASWTNMTSYTAKLTASDGASINYYGQDVTISEDKIVIGANGFDAFKGAAYVYVKPDTGWLTTSTHAEKITGDSPETMDMFGGAVAIDSGLLVIGTQLDNDNANDAGSATTYSFVCGDGDLDLNEECDDGNTVNNDGCTATCTVVQCLPSNASSTKITAPAPARGLSFARVVDIDGDYAIAGSPYEDGKGAAYIFHRTSGNNWDSGYKLTAFDGVAEDQFGGSVAISGDYAVVGDESTDDGGSASGNAFVFHRTGTNTWDSGTKIAAGDPASDDHFGHSVGIQTGATNDYIIVGSVYDDDGGFTSGSAYIFRRTGTNAWTDRIKIIASDDASEDQFGGDVAITDDFVIVGANYDDSSFTDSGSAYIYHRTGTNTWGEETKLIANDEEQDGWFGWSVDITPTYAIVGAYRDNNFAGAAYIVQNTGVNTWTDQVRLVPSDFDPADQPSFGNNVYIDDELAIVYSGESGGRLHFFENSGANVWNETTNFIAEDSEAGDVFGLSVGRSGDYLVASVQGSSEGADNAGAFIVYDLIQCSVSTCGDSITEELEECDDGNLVNADGCDSSCVSETCGNGILQAYEACDDNNTDNDDGCSAVCTIDVCDPTCSSAAYCGNGNLDAGEECDDGNTNSDDGCSDICNFDICAGPLGATENRVTGNAGGFGRAVAVDGDYAVVGAPQEGNNNPFNDGSAYVFHKVGGVWGQIAELMDPSQTTNPDFEYYAFGYDVDISGDYIIVGVERDKVGSFTDYGSAYIYHRTGETTFDSGTQILPPSGDWVEAVAIDGDYAVITSNRIRGGRLYVFHRIGDNTWDSGTEIHVIGAPYFSQFGLDVDIDGDYIVTGSSFFDDYNGALIVFHRTDTNTWDSGTMIPHADVPAGSGFGYNVAISGDYVVTGAFQIDKAYVYRRIGTNDWDSGFELAPSSGEQSFGYPLAIKGNRIMVGDQDANGQSNDSGAVYIFDRDGVNSWSETDILSPITGSTVSFGGAIDFTENDVLVGDIYDSGVGAAFFFDNGQCFSSICGNGLLEGAETCDDGNAVSEDGCSSACLLETCGDNLIQTPEACDGEFLCAVDCSGYDTICALPDNTDDEVKIPLNDNALTISSSDVNISGDYAFIGATNSGPNLYYVEIYKKNGANWNYLKTLTDGVAGSGYGLSLDATGDLLIVGAYADTGALPYNNNIFIPTAYASEGLGGTAFIYGKDVGGLDNWGLIKEIRGSDSIGGDHFGWDVSIDGDVAVVSAPDAYSETNSSIGKVYIFGKDVGNTNNWGQIKKITGPDEPTPYLGYSIDLDGTRLAIGAPGKNSYEGVIFIHEKNQGGPDNWGQVMETTGSDIFAGALLGYSVALSGSNLLAGAPDVAGATPGYVYVFGKDIGDTDNWGQVTKFTGHDLPNGSFFGFNLALDNDIAIGSPSNTAEGVYTFFKNQGEPNDWGEIQKVLSSDTDGADQFGYHLGIHNGHIIASSPGADAGMGAAYIYDEPVCAAPSTGGGHGPQGRPVCTDSAIGYDLPSRLAVSLVSGNPAVQIDWSRNVINPALTVDVYRNADFLASVAYPATSYTDTTVVPSVCNKNVAGSCAVKQVSYYVQTRNSCGESANGASGTAFINPTVPAGTPVLLSADLAVVIKEGFGQLFKEKLSELEDLSKASSSDSTSTLTNTDTSLLRQQAEAACTTARDLYYRSKDTRTNERLASDYLVKCFGDGLLTPDDVAPLIPPLIQFRLEPADVEALIQQQVQKIIDSKGITTVLRSSLGTIDVSKTLTLDTLATDTSGTLDTTRESILCGGNTVNCSDADKALIESFFEGSSNAADITINVLDSSGTVITGPISVHTDIFGRANNVPLGTILSGTDYSIKLTLDDEPYVLPKILPINVTNPTPATINGSLAFIARLPLTFRDQFCFGDFDQNETINLDDMFTLRTLIDTVGETSLFSIWDSINLDGIASFDLSDMVTLLQNFQCSTTVDEPTLTLQELGRGLGF